MSVPTKETNECKELILCFNNHYSCSNRCLKEEL